MATKKDRQQLPVASGPDRAKRAAELFLEQGPQMAVALHEWPREFGNALDVGEVMLALEAKIKTLLDGDLRPVEEMLYGQALALQGMFSTLACRAATQESMAHYERHLNLALKAQAQCRATLTALAEVRNPRQVAFVKQANIAAGPQQVNNGVASPSHTRTGNAPPEQSKLLEDRRGEWLDTGTEGPAGAAHPPLEAVGAVDRAADSGGQGNGKSQRLQGRALAGVARDAEAPEPAAARAGRRARGSR